MKKLLFLLGLTPILLSSCKQKSSPFEPNETSVSDFSSDSLYIAQQFSAQLSGWNAGSIPSYMQAYHNSTDLQFITSKGVLRGWQAVHDNYLRAFPNQEKMGKLQFTVDQYTPLSDSIIQTTGIWEVQKNDTTRSGYFSLIWKQFPDENWKIIIDHTW